METLFNTIIVNVRQITECDSKERDLKGKLIETNNVPMGVLS